MQCRCQLHTIEEEPYTSLYDSVVLAHYDVTAAKLLKEDADAPSSHAKLSADTDIIAAVAARPPSADTAYQGERAAGSPGSQSSDSEWLPSRQGSADSDMVLAMSNMVLQAPLCSKKPDAVAASAASPPRPAAPPSQNNVTQRIAALHAVPDLRHTLESSDVQVSAAVPVSKPVASTGSEHAAAAHATPSHHHAGVCFDEQPCADALSAEVHASACQADLEAGPAAGSAQHTPDVSSDHSASSTCSPASSGTDAAHASTALTCLQLDVSVAADAHTYVTQSIDTTATSATEDYSEDGDELSSLNVQHSPAMRCAGATGKLHGPVDISFDPMRLSSQMCAAEDVSVSASWSPAALPWQTSRIQPAVQRRALLSGAFRQPACSMTLLTSSAAVASGSAATSLGSSPPGSQAELCMHRCAAAAAAEQEESAFIHGSHAAGTSEDDRACKQAACLDAADAPAVQSNKTDACQQATSPCVELSEQHRASTQHIQHGAEQMYWGDVHAPAKTDSPQHEAAESQQACATSPAVAPEVSGVALVPEDTSLTSLASSPYPSPQPPVGLPQWALSSGERSTPGLPGSAGPSAQASPARVRGSAASARRFDAAAGGPLFAGLSTPERNTPGLRMVFNPLSMPTPESSSTSITANEPRSDAPVSPALQADDAQNAAASQAAAAGPVLASSASAGDGGLVFATLWNSQASYGRECQPRWLGSPAGSLAPTASGTPPLPFREPGCAFCLVCLIAWCTRSCLCEVCRLCNAQCARMSTMQLCCQSTAWHRCASMSCHEHCHESHCSGSCCNPHQRLTVKCLSPI